MAQLPYVDLEEAERLVHPPFWWGISRVLALSNLLRRQVPQAAFRGLVGIKYSCELEVVDVVTDGEL